MEAIGAASAIAGIVSLSGGILAKGYTFLASVHRAPQELRELLCEAAALNSVLNQLQTLLEEDHHGSFQQDTNETRKSGLKDIADTGVLHECTESLLLVDRSVQRCQQIRGQDLRNLGKRVMWPFKEKETKEALARLSRIRGHLTAALTVDMAAARETAISVTGLEEWTAERDQVEQHRALIAWLDPHSINMEENLKEGLKNRHPGTGQWLFETDCYKSWAAGHSSVLWIHGIRKIEFRHTSQAHWKANKKWEAGSGKTVLASSAIEKLLGHGLDPSIGMVYFYFDHRDANKRTLQHFLASTTLQLLSRKPALESEVVGEFQRQCNQAEKPKPISLDEQLRLFITMTQSFDVVTVVIDALDECKDIEEFTHQGLEHIISVKDVTVRVLTTGRNNYLLERTIGMLASYRITLEDEVVSDIEAYVTDQVEYRSKARKLKVRSTELKDQIVHELSHHSRGMFIWVTFQLDLISRLTSDKAIRDALRKLPGGLNNTYIQLLEQIRDRNAEQVGTIAKALKWIVSSLVPLTLGQLVEAISIDPEDTHLAVDKMFNDEKDLLEMLGSLVVFDPVKEDPVSLASFYVPPQAIMDIGITCAQYLSFTDFGEPCHSVRELRERVASYKLLEFAADNFLSQLRSYGGRGSAIKSCLPSLRWFVEPSRHGQQNFISWQQVYHGSVVGKSPADSLVPNPITYIIEHNVLHLLDVFLLHSNEEYHQTILQSGFTPLHLAVITGREDRLAEILRSSPDLEALGNRGQTALHLAAEYGHVGMIKLLLEAGASPHARSESESTPFYRAARNGSIAALELLADAGSDLDAMTWDWWTPVFEAIENHNLPAVEWLVQRGVNLRQKLLHGPSVVEFARSAGDEAIIEIVQKGLLEHRF
ncbi:nkyrin repeat protein [Diaporthe amygdali]|uniref:nkyrin repeat protein n=1 Tax=Phomopsis amygdali TaxID=1214568 RepID=UPI0022FF3268|nr:nkyrin repeat protein [Diaporthe amygdali]KAJ0108932.1 nkyrin repeat protein [Diaporthe amygdali]